jgi:3-isopropylmalate/(R)-2-methylmalate dehydratase large subunit
MATPDHNVPTENRIKGVKGISDSISKLQVVTLEENVKKYDLNFFSLRDERQGIVHVIGPEQGLTLPGMTVVCGDSHTSTHGAFGALAMGIGTSEVEHVLATQCLIAHKQKNMRIKIEGDLLERVSAKDVTMFIIGQIGTAGGTGFNIEYAGNTIERLSMEGRMTLCNMSIEAGARSGMVAPDQITFEYIKDKPFSPVGNLLDKALKTWSALKTDEDAIFDKEFVFSTEQILPQVTWGTSPEMVSSINEKVPEPKYFKNKENYEDALSYMGLKPGTKLTDISLDQIFIGSCTNSRIEDLRIAAEILEGNKLAKNIKRAMVVPGSGLVKKQAEEEGLHEIFIDAGFLWRDAGCSMCLGMNPDQLNQEERCASTSNRNFEGRQGYKGRTHLVSPAMAAAAAIEGRFIDVREI